MNPFALASALCLGAASVFSAFSRGARRGAWERVSRAMAVLGAVAVTPALFDPSTRTQAVFVAGVGVFSPSPFPGLLAAICALLLGWGSTSGGGVSLLLVAGSAVVAARAFSSRLSASSVCGVAAFAGLLSAAGLLVWDQGRILHWRFEFASRLGGSGLLLGLACLGALGGGLLLLALRLASGEVSLALAVGRRALILSATLALLGAILGSIVVPAQRPDLLPEAGRGLALLWGVAGALVLGAISLLVEEPTVEPEHRSDVSLAFLFASLALCGAGVEAWLREGTSLGGDVPRILPAVLLGLASLQGRRGTLAVRGFFLLSLLRPLVT